MNKSIEVLVFVGSTLQGKLTKLHLHSWNGFIGHHNGWIGIIHEWAEIPTQDTNKLVSNKAKKRMPGTLGWLSSRGRGQWCCLGGMD